MTKPIFLLALALFLCSGASAMQAPPTGLELRVDQVSLSGQVTVSLRSTDKGTIKIWRGGTAWDAAPWRILHISNRTGELRAYYQEPPAVLNGFPEFREVSQDKPREIKLDLNSGWWLPRRRDEQTTFEIGDTVIAIYDVPSSSEGEKLGVWWGVAAAKTVVQ